MTSLLKAAQERREREEGPPQFKRRSTTTILKAHEAPMRWVVPGFVGEGLTILAGRKKLGKSWLAMDWAIAVASGGKAFGSVACEAGDVLYIDLQNGQRRIRTRIETLFPDESARPDLARLEWANSTPTLHDGFDEALDEWIGSVRRPRLIVLDGPPHPDDMIRDVDCMFLTDLQVWALENSVAVLILYRTRAGASDPLERRGAPARLASYADTTLLLERDAAGYTLQLQGRDIEEHKVSLGFDGERWSILGEAAEVRHSVGRGQVLELLKACDHALTSGDVAGELDLPVDNVRRMLSRMVKAGEVRRCAYGRYEFRVPTKTMTTQSFAGDVELVENDAEWVTGSSAAELSDAEPVDSVSDVSDLSDSIKTNMKTVA